MSQTTEVMFVCWGNICRSPMAMVVAREFAAREGLSGVRFTSAAVSSDEIGRGMDRRAIATLTEAGYVPGEFSAHQITQAEARAASMVIGMEPLHLNRVRRLVPEARNLHLLTDFDPDAIPGSSVEDPWYGDLAGFQGTLRQIEAAMSAVIRRAGELASGPTLPR